MHSSPRFFSRCIMSLLSSLILFSSVFIGGPLPERDICGKGDADIRIMSFNLRCVGLGEKSVQSRSGIVAQTVAEYFPDSFGSQEATYEWMLYLEAKLPEYDYVGVARGDGNTIGEFSPIFYLKSKYKVTDSGTFWISETPDTPSKGWDADCRRICTWAVLENKKTGESYVHINTHLDHVGNEARKHGVEMILEKASEFDIPVAVTGDFNFVEGSALYRTLTSDILSDTKFTAPDTMKYTTYHDYHPENYVDNPCVLDYVLINQGFTALKYAVINSGIDGKFVSDHFPIYADISFVK